MHNTGLEKIGLLHPSGVRNDTVEIRKKVINWKESSSVQRLLDVISSILVEEYVAVAKLNPEEFAVCTPLPIPPHKGGGNLGMEKENGGEK